jgi:hypothetical protein
MGWLKRLGWGGVVITIIIVGFSRYLDYKDAVALGWSGDVWLSIGLGVFFVCVIALLLWWQRLLSQKTTECKPTTVTKPEVYLTRTEMTANRGAFAEEFEDMEKIWAIWSTGKIISAGGNLERIHMERLVLTNPKNEFLMQYQEPICRDKDVAKIQRHISQHYLTIEEIADSASGTGCEVRLYDGPVKDSIIIADIINYKGDEFSDGAFVRIETGAPFVEYENRINIVIEKSKHKDVFKSFVKHYNEVWDRSEPYITSNQRTNQLLEKEKTTPKDYHLVWLSGKFFLKGQHKDYHSYNNTDEKGKISLILRPQIRVNTLKRILVQSIALLVGTKEIPSDMEAVNDFGESETIDDIEFEFPLDTPRGKQVARIKALVDGKEYISDSFFIDFPRRNYS